MNTLTINTYKYDELSPEAQAKAREWYRSIDDEWQRADEYIASLNKLAEHFGGKLKHFSFQWDNFGFSFAEFNMPDEVLDDNSIDWSLLGTYDPETLRGHGECKLTGLCYDENAIDGFRTAWFKDGERDLDKLMQAAFRSWFKAARADYDYDQSDEAVAESIELNEYDFTAEGNRNVVL